jgi:hypothetical protein
MRCGQFRGEGIEQPYPAGHDLDGAAALELGQCPAYGLDGETEMIGDVASAHRNRQWIDIVAKARQAIAPAAQKDSNFLVGCAPSQLKHLVMGIGDLGRHQRDDLDKKVRTMAREMRERFTRDFPDHGRADGGG